MGLVVNNNIPALQAFNAVSSTTNSLQKSIQKLSTGLRINSAADDAAGLAISEKMRAQIRGLDRAVMNSQDGISMIQTAEGALNETHSILQRMRELSVQAANDTLTQQDRAYIQLEIDQLREEATRIGNTTQFNKKKLLDGSAAVLWSAGDGYTKAIVNGGLRTIDQFGQKKAAEGNYKINVQSLGGSGEVKKTDIFKIKHEKTQTFNLTSMASTSAGGFVTSVIGTNMTEAATGTTNNYTVAGGAFVGAGSALSAAINNNLGTGGSISVAAGTTLNANLGGASILVERLDDTGSSKVTANIVSKDGTSRTVEKIYEGVVSNRDLGELDAALSGVTLTTSTANATNGLVGGKSAYSLAGSTAGATANTIIKASNSAGAAGQAFNFHMSDNIAGKTVDYIVYSVDRHTGDITNSKITVTYDSAYKGAGFASATTVANLSANDSTLTWGLIGDTANERVKLSDIDKFWNSEGRFLLTDPKTLTLTQGDGKQTTITLYGNDTVGNFVDKLNKAIGSRNGIGQSAYTGDQKFAQFGNGAPNTALGARGTIVISSVVAGAMGKLSFAGDEDVLKALSVNVIKEATESDYKIKISDAHTGNILVDGVQVTGNKLIGLVHSNIDVIFDAMIGVSAKMKDDGSGFYVYTRKDADLYLHLADNTTVYQIGANEGEDMGVNIGDMRSTALGLDSVLVTNRESAARSITIIDNAIDRVSMQRAKLGAYQNRLEHTITNLTVAAENLTAAESRIRDTDMAKEMMNFTKLQIMLQAGTSMLAQANMLPQNVLGLLR